MRLEEKEQHNLKYNICKKELIVRNIILLHDIRCIKDMSQKLAFKWLDLYQISNVIRDKNIYI